MKSEWRNFLLEDVCEKIYSGGTPSTKHPEYWGGNLKWLSSGETSQRFIYDTERKITQLGADNSSTKLATKGCTVIATVGQGYTRGQASFLMTDTYMNQSVIACKPNVNIIEPLFLYYNLDNRYEEFRLLSDGTSTRGGLSGWILKRMEIIIPPLQEQRKIAGILKSLDDKIELNNAINKNLEQQAQAIFTWYMENFPYTLSPLGDMAEIIDCLHTKKPDAVENSKFQLLQLNNITDSGFLDLSYKYYISKSDYENWTRKCEIVAGDCVITNVGRIGAVSQAPIGTHAAMGRNMTCIRLKKDKPFYSYLITALLSNHIRKEIMKNTDEGTIMGALNVKNIPLLLFPMFESSTMIRLEDILSPIRKAIERNYLSNQTLALLRDTLLPKLMSGEIDVTGIDL